MISSNPIIPVILCGGSGTRLWPLSRESFPKQFLVLDKKSGKSLLQKTYQRLLGIKDLLDPIIVCNEEHRFLVAEQMREIQAKPNTILLEPIGRNTAPAVALSALLALEKENDPLLLILSSDHDIKNKKDFHNAIEISKSYALKNRLVTFGIVPTYPEIGYGYIKGEKNFNLNNIVGINISKFIEKPNMETAKKLIKDKSYTWNSGMFVFKAKTILKEMGKYSPEIVHFCESSLNESIIDLDFKRLNKESFEKCPDLSLDVAIMEKSKIGTVIPLNAGWSDIGSWKSVWENSDKDENENLIEGKVITKDTKSSLIRSEKKLIVGLGLKNLIIIDTNDAILIADKMKDQEVKNIVKELKSKKMPEGFSHQKVYRPWGDYVSIAYAKNWQVKIINVKPGESLSLQRHKHRAEHWIIVNGTAKVEIDDLEHVLIENQSTYIPLGSKHRLSNPGETTLSLIEIQSGSYLGEDDIERFEDNYGRIK